MNTLRGGWMGGRERNYSVQNSHWKHSSALKKVFLMFLLKKNEILVMMA